MCSFFLRFIIWSCRRYFTTSSDCQTRMPILRTSWISDTVIDEVDDDSLVSQYTDSVTCAEVSLGVDVQNLFDDLSYTITEYETSGTTGTASSSSSSSCFASSETVQVENGRIVSIADVTVGDRVLAADGIGAPTFAEVVAVPHDTKNTVRAEFVQLITATGDIKLTADHLIIVSEECDGDLEAQLSAAKDVVVGDCLLTASGALDAVEAVVEFVQGTGVHTIVTDAEFVVVNGYVASPFAHNHAVANAYYNIIRFVNKFVSANNFAASKVFTCVNANLGTLVADFSTL
jgi:hypothetical protein